MPGNGRRGPNGGRRRVGVARVWDRHHIAAAVRRAVRGSLGMQRDHGLPSIGRVLVGDLRCLRRQHRRHAQRHRQTEKLTGHTTSSIILMSAPCLGGRVGVRRASRHEEGRNRGKVTHGRKCLPGKGVTKVAGCDSLGWDWLPATPRSSTIPCITYGGGGPVWVSGGGGGRGGRGGGSWGRRPKP